MSLDRLTIGRDGFDLPAEAVTETFAIVGKRGKGKTYTASVIAEEMLDDNNRIVALDPMGIWWGLRLGADGKSAGYPVYVFGGDHGDLGFGSEDGATLATAIIEADVSAIVDLSRLKKGERLRFIIDFAHQLFDANQTPRHVFLEEADDYCHERPHLPDSRMARSAVEDLVKRGRTRGLGITMVTQRPAALAKDVLTQAEVFICHGINAPQDRKAVDEWIKANAEPEKREEFLESLAKLGRGECWVWSPGWLEQMARIQVRERRTYDASSTPTLTARRKVTLHELDLRRLEALLSKPEPEPGESPAKQKGQPAAQCKGHLERIRELEGEVNAAREGREELRREFDLLAERAEKAIEMGKEVTDERDVLRRQLNGVDSLRSGLLALLGDSVGAGAAVAAIDEETIIARVLARIPAGGQVVQVRPPEALRKKYLQQAAERLYAKVEGVDADARTVIEYLIGQDKQLRLADIARALSGSASGPAYDRWRKPLKALANIDLVEIKKTDRELYRADVRGGVEAELASHSATPDEIDAVVQQVLYRLTEKR